MRPKLTESELGKVVIAHLRADGWEIYQEVSPAGDDVCDVVATRGPLLLACELKTTLSLDVLEQAERWRRFAHLVYAAVPRAHRLNSHSLFVACRWSSTTRRTSPSRASARRCAG